MRRRTIKSEAASDEGSLDGAFAVSETPPAGPTWVKRPDAVPSPWEQGEQPAPVADAVPAVVTEEPAAAPDEYPEPLTAVPPPAELLAIARDALLSGTPRMPPAKLAAALHEVATAACVLHVAEESRRMIDLVLTRRAIVFGTDKRIRLAKPATTGAK